MQIKINFDQLFNSGQQLNSTFEAHSSDIDHSFQSSLNNSFEYKFTLNQPLFDQSASQSQHIKLIDEDEFDEENRSFHTKKSTKTKQSGTTVRTSQPGQRLFYESQEAQVRKNKQRERIQQEKVAELKSMPFVPKINKNSRRLAQKFKTQQREQYKQRPQTKTTKEVKEEQLLKQCTFQPKLIAKNNKTQTKSKQELFYYLHNTSKIKEIKKSRKAEQELQASKMKKVSKQHFIEFLKRNEEYNNVIKKKHEIMKQKADNYDLNTGQKLFSPKISDNKLQNFIQKNSSSKNILISPKNAEYRTNPIKRQTQKKIIQSEQDKKKMKSNLFAKKQRVDNFQYMQARQEKQSKIQISSKHTQKQQDYYSEQYRQYTEQFDRRTAAVRQANLSHHQIIPQQSEHSFHQAEKLQQNDIQNEIEEAQDQKNQFLEYQVEEQQTHPWNSHQIKPFELSNVNQYLNASQQDEPQPRNNYVMDILNNLMSSKQQQD